MKEPRTGAGQGTDAIRVAERAALVTKAARINEAHHAGNAAAISALEHYRLAGDLLNKVKDELPHGEFGPWLKHNFEGSQQTASNYMRVSKNWDALIYQRAGNLSLRAALAELSEPKDKPEEAPQPEQPARLSSAARMRSFIETNRALREVRDKRFHRDTHASFEAYVTERFCNGENEKAEKVMQALADPSADIAASIYARIFEIAPDLELTGIGIGIPTMPEDLTFDQHVELFRLFSSIGALYGHEEAA